MPNLLEETLVDIADSGHTPEDIIFIGSSDGEYRCTWEEFKRLASNRYDSSYGSQEVAADLIIVFNDTKKMWRSEYDGSEWWAYDAPRTVDYTQPGKPITNLFTKHYESSIKQLHELTNEDE